MLKVPLKIAILRPTILLVFVNAAQVNKTSLTQSASKISYTKHNSVTEFSHSFTICSLINIFYDCAQH